jgi:Gamma-glutamyltranspeptidase
MQSGDRRIAFGIMGGFNQTLAHAQFVSNVVDFGMNIQAALESARFTKRDFGGCGVWVENGVAPGVIAGLRSEGHDVTVWPRYFQGMGRGNAVEASDSSPVHYGATDPRADGEAVPETNALLETPRSSTARESWTERIAFLNVLGTGESVVAGTSDDAYSRNPALKPDTMERSIGCKLGRFVSEAVLITLLCLNGLEVSPHFVASRMDEDAPTRLLSQGFQSAGPVGKA